MGITFINRNQTENIGDLMSSPQNYFLEFKSCDKVDIMFSTRKNLLHRLNYLRTINKNLIVGGGGLFLRDSFKESIRNIKNIKVAKTKIVWGAGHNSISSLININDYANEISGFDLVGIRDYNASKKMNVHFTPCVSCLDPNFGKYHTPTKEIGIIEHEHIKLDNVHGFPKMVNNGPFDETLEFIRTYDKIITNSYHGMYWSLLEGKKVVIIPNSSKFFDFIYTPVSKLAVSEIDFEKDFKAPHFNILSDCIAQNQNFKILVDAKITY